MWLDLSLDMYLHQHHRRPNFFIASSNVSEVALKTVSFLKKKQKNDIRSDVLRE